MDLCDKDAIEAVFDLHRYATKIFLDKVILGGTMIFRFLLLIGVQMVEYVRPLIV